MYLVLVATALSVASPARSQTINPTGRTIDLVTPIVQDGRFVGDASLRIGADDTLSVNAAGVAGLLGDRIDPDVAAAVIARADADGRVALSAFAEAGAPLDYDPASLSLTYTPTREALGERSLSLGDERTRAQDTLAPARLSGFVNLTGGVRYASDEEGSGPDLDDLGIEGAVRTLGTVFEGAARYDPETGDVERRYLRAIYDRPQSGNRFVAGDYRTPFSGLVGDVDILGVAVENTGALRPFDTLRPRGRTSFELERTATVEIYANGTLERRLRLEPGVYDLTDIRLAPGANDITVLAEDDLGQRELTRFNGFFRDDLLARGRKVYAFAAGVVAGTGADGPVYDEGRPALSGQVDYGLTDEMTVGAAARLTTERSIAGLSALTVGPFGTVDIDLAGSHGKRDGIGAAAEMRWRKAFGRTDPLSGFRDEAVTATFGIRSEDFADGDPFDVENGRGSRYLLDLSLGYTRPLSGNLTLGLGAFYGHAGRSEDDDRFQFQAALGGSLGERIGWSVRGRYVSDKQDENEGFGIGLQVGLRLGNDAGASVYYDSLDNRMGGTLRYTRGRGVGAWSAGLSGSRSDEGDPGLTATVSHTANRFVASAFHRESFGADDRRETGLRFGTAIAVADGRFAIGRPIEGAFVIADAHPTLADKAVILGQQGDTYEAHSGAFGPALASGYSAYRPARISTDVEDLPIGYDLGKGVAELEPPYRAGYRVVIGSDTPITVTGTLVDRFGDPLELETGIARHRNDPDFPPLQVFTNRTGRFALLGAKAGPYRLEMSGGDIFGVEAPEGAIGLVRAGQVVAQ